MKPAGTSCNIPIGQNPPTWRGNDIVLARPWPDDLVQCRSSCAGGGISACCSTPQRHRASYPGATSPSPRVSHRGSNGDGKPSTAKTCPPTAQCLRKATANTCHQIPSTFPSITTPTKTTTITTTPIQTPLPNSIS